MNNGILRTVKAKNGILNLDPRTKLFLLVLICIFTLGSAGGEAASLFLPVLAAAPFVFLLSSAKWGGALLYATLYVTAWLLETQVLPVLTGAPFIIILILCGFISHFMPCVMMGYFVMTTITISEFVAALEKMHIPSTITIPLSVMFRFFPTVIEETNAVNDGVRMRGLRFGHGNPVKMVEYRLIPLLTCSIKTGEELSAASLTRGLGTPVKRTNVCKIGFGPWDYIFFAAGIFFIMSVVIVNILG